MININDKKKCCGCAACYSVCPKSAISMNEDEEGFLYPFIDSQKCVDCGLCEKVCPVVDTVASDSLLLSYAAYNKDENIRSDSSSGGMFNAFAEKILECGGVIYGAAFNEAWDVVHLRVDVSSDLHKLRGSKYVQSAVNETYLQVKTDLTENKKVLFSGTPCQVAGLKRFLGCEDENLYTVDFICHGVPSRLVWRMYVKYRANIAKSKIAQVCFRLKNEGWEKFSMKVEFENATAYCRNLKKDIFLRGFLENLYLRPSCHKCMFKTKERVSDITVADFWDIETLLPEMYDDEGVSAVVIHSEKGKDLFDKCKDGFCSKQVAINDIVNRNEAMIMSASINPGRDRFFCDFRNGSGDVKQIIKRYLKKWPSQYYIKKRVKKVLVALGLFPIVKKALHALK